MQGSWKETETGFAYEPNVIFVFGSNLAGRHGKGAALFARRHYGAIYGVGVGRTGNSYAIPTKDILIKTLPLCIIEFHVENFLAYAKSVDGERFRLTRVGCGLAGYKDHQMAPMFRGVTSNVMVPNEWKQYLGLH